MSPIVLACALLVSACASMPSVAAYPPLVSSDLTCVNDADGVTWVRAAPLVHRPTLDAWCASVGPPWLSPDIAQLAQAAGMSAVYVPSMRNGGGPVEPQDRGNAILTTEAFSAPTAIELPFGRQRRVAVGATIHEIRFVSVHLDTGRDRVAQADALAGVVSTTAGASVVAGDLNSIEGRQDGTYKALEARLAPAPCGDRRTHAWPWRLELFFGGWVGRLDHIFTNLPSDRWSHSCLTVPHFFGSDHRPLVLVLRAT